MEDIAVVKGGGIVILPKFSHHLHLFHTNQHILTVGPPDHPMSINRTVARAGALVDGRVIDVDHGMT